MTGLNSSSLIIKQISSREDMKSVDEAANSSSSISVELLPEIKDNKQEISSSPVGQNIEKLKLNIDQLIAFLSVDPVKESVIAQEFASQFVSRLIPGAKILSIGTGYYNESELALSQAGYDVTVVDMFDEFKGRELPYRLNPLEEKFKKTRLSKEIREAKGNYQVFRDKFDPDFIGRELKGEKFDLVIMANIPGLNLGYQQTEILLETVLSDGGYLVTVTDWRSNVNQLVDELKSRGAEVREFEGMKYYDLDRYKDIYRSYSNRLEPPFWVKFEQIAYFQYGQMEASSSSPMVDKLTEILRVNWGEDSRVVAERDKNQVFSFTASLNQYNIGDIVEDQEIESVGQVIGYEIVSRRNILEKIRLINTIGIQVDYGGGRVINYRDKKSLDNLSRVEDKSNSKDFVVYSRSFETQQELEVFIKSIDNDERETPYNLKFKNEKWVIEVLHPKLSWKRRESKRIINSPHFSGRSREAKGHAYYVPILDLAIFNELERNDINSEAFFDGQEVLMVGADNALIEVIFLLKKFSNIKKIVIAELNTENVKDMLAKVEELGLTNKVEISRVDFFKMGQFLGEWQSRFGVVLSHKVFEMTIQRHHFRNISKAWDIIQRVLIRPGLFVGQLQKRNLNLLSAQDNLNDIKVSVPGFPKERGVVISSLVDVNKGGIDLNPINLNLETQGKGINFNELIDPQLLESLTFSLIDGFTPVILNIVPVTNLRLFLGLKDQEEEPSNIDLSTREMFYIKEWNQEEEFI